MAVAYDASASGTNGGYGQYVQYSHTVGTGAGGYLLVVVGNYQYSQASQGAVPTYGNVGMTLLGSYGNNNGYMSLWGLANPPTGANNVVVAPPGYTATSVISHSFTGVTASTLTASGAPNVGNTSANASVTVTGVNVGDIVWAAVDGFGGSGFSTFTPSANSIGASSAGYSGSNIAAGYAVASSSSVTLSATLSESEFWAFWAVRLTGQVSAQSGDTGAGTDAGTVRTGTPATDSGSGSDAGTVAGIAPGAETGSGTEAQSVVAKVGSSDTATGVDSGGVGGQTAGGESGSGGDAGTVFVAVPSSDSGTGVDSTGLLKPVADSDQGTGTDSGQVAAQIGSGDTGSGAETATSGANRIDGDTGVGTDAGTVVVTTPSGDTSTGTDTGGYFTSQTDTDTAAGTDAGSAVAYIADSDRGTGVDSSTSNTTVIVTSRDSGTGTDSSAAAIPGYRPSRARTTVVPAAPRLFVVPNGNRTTVVAA